MCRYIRRICRRCSGLAREKLLTGLRARYRLSEVQQSAAFANVDSAIQKLVIDVANNRTAFAQVIFKESLAIREHVTEEIQHVKSEIGQLREDVPTQAHRDKVLESLAFSHMYARQESIADAHKNTFRWILDASDGATRPWHNFRQWLEHNNDMYWIQGQAGCGKSTLMRFVCEE